MIYGKSIGKKKSVDTDREGSLQTFGRNEVTSGRGLAMDHRLDA